MRDKYETHDVAVIKSRSVVVLIVPSNSVLGVWWLPELLELQARPASAPPSSLLFQR